MNAKATTDVLRDTISRETAFDHGELFESQEQVREYFTAENIAAMFGSDVDMPDDATLDAWADIMPDDATLDAWADIVITHRWHCDF